MGWRTGDFSTTGFVAGGVVIGKFILCGLGVGTYRERFHFDANRRALTLKRQVLFVTYLRREWSMHDFEAVELFWNCRDVNNTNHWFQEIRLLCAKDGAGAAERFTLGSGKAEKEMRGLAQEIADFCSLPLREPPKGAGW